MLFCSYAPVLEIGLAPLRDGHDVIGEEVAVVFRARVLGQDPVGLFPALQSAAQSVDVGHSFDLAQILDAELGADGSQTLDALRSTHESADLVAGGNELAAHANELAVEPLSFFKPADSAAVLASDPFEPVNRLVFRFNEQLDRRLIRPVARVYLQTLPGPLRDGFSNMLLKIGRAHV